ncbi:olfactory receptor 52P1-like [Gastrophryne carolinensis]
MSAANKTFFQPQSFILVGIPGLEFAQFWIAIPVVIMYIVTVLGNSLMLVVILPKENFHKPMYLFFCMLAITDILSSTAISPKSLSIFWFQDNEIGFSACLAQLYFVHTSTAFASTVLLAMAFDRYIAICYPLRYNSILTNPAITKIGIVAIFRGSCLIAPLPLLITRLSYCRNNIILHTYCEHMAVVKIACSNTAINRVYGLIMALVIAALDIIGIFASYCAIVRAVFRLSSKEARLKALCTCGPHLCILLIAYFPALFSFFAHRFGHNIPPHVHIIFANLYFLVPNSCNSIIYGARNKEIQRGVVAIFRKQ